MPPRKPDPVRNQLRVLKDLGFGFLEEIRVGAPAVREEHAPQGPFAEPEPSPGVFEGAALPIEERVEHLAAIGAEVGKCSACRLCSSRTNVVPGEGDPMAGLVFVGEGPGAEEDRLGRPFVGKSGELLTKIIEAMQFRREDVFIGNVVKCRPPGNRNPEPDEMETCLPFLRRQIGVIRPRVIVALGKTALGGLLPQYRTAAITKLRGTWLNYEGIPLMPTFHPAYLLRSPTQKKFVWEDMQQVMAVFGKTPPKR